MPLAIAGLAPWLLAQQDDGWRLRDVRTIRDDVFTAEQADGNPLYWLANLLHATTQQEVVTREVWLHRGDRVTAHEREEIERNLRAMGLFGAVHGELLPVGEGEADLVLHTRDRFSLTASASVARVGGVDRLSFRLSDSNLLGTGKALVAASNRTDDDRTAWLRYHDPQLFGSRLTLSARTGNTDEGDFTDLELQRPFRRLDDPHAFGVRVVSEDEDIDRHRAGERVAEVPTRQRMARLYGALGNGPREQRTTWGLDLRLHRHDYEPAFGVAAAQTRVPGDTDEVEFGPYFAIDWRPEFQRVRGLDAIDFDEDLPIGAHLGLRLAARHRNEAGRDAAIQPVVGFDARFATNPAPATWLTFAGFAQARTEDRLLAGWHAGAALHGFWQGLTAQTWAASLTGDIVGERQDLQAQVTLGEDSGLRGYPAREFTGSRRVRLNLEDRIDTGVQILSVHLGLAAFADVGWVHGAEERLSLDQAWRGVGCGLRLGSSHLFGNRVLRLDVAWPLDERDRDDYGVSVSFSVGQVFAFFGNADTLERDF